MVLSNKSHLWNHSLILVILIVLLYISVGARANAQNEDLINAAANGHLSRVEALLIAGTDVNAKNSEGQTALFWALTTQTERQFDIVKILISAGADVNTEGRQGQTALIRFSGEGHFDFVQMLLSKGANVNARTINGFTALMASCQPESYSYNVFNLSEVETLLAKGADVNARTDSGITALWLASEKGNIDAVNVLLANGADINATYNGETALNTASRHGFVAIEQALIAKGADVNSKGFLGNTILIFELSSRPSIENVQKLLALGADVNARNNEGYTALMLATKDSNRDIVEALIVKGADVNAKSFNGLTAIDIALENHERKIIQTLISHGAVSDKITKPTGNAVLNIVSPDINIETRSMDFFFEFDDEDSSDVKLPVNHVFTSGEEHIIKIDAIGAIKCKAFSGSFEIDVQNNNPMHISFVPVVGKEYTLKISISANCPNDVKLEDNKLVSFHHSWSAGIARATLIEDDNGHSVASDTENLHY